MGNRRSGRRRTPTVVKRLTGARVRHDVSAEPTAPVGIPERPPHIAVDPDASAAWDALATRLTAQRVLTTAHREGLALLADAWATYVRMQRDFALVNRRTVLVQEWKDHEGVTRSRVVENPLARQIRLQALLLNTLFGEFGQTPASAPKVSTNSDSVDPFESFLASGPATVVPFVKRSKGTR